MTSVAVLVPVLNRPHRVRPLLASLEAARPAHGHRVDPVFLCSPGDTDEIAAVAAAGETPVVVAWRPGRGDYAKKINHGFRQAHADGYEWILQAADDVEFRPGWLERALAAHRRTRACWIGTNDMANTRVMAGRHATHSLIHRDYLECGTIDEPGKILHEGYSHWFCDDEGCQTAMFRRTWAFARDSVVAHLHPVYGTAPDDETYRKGQAAVHEDSQLYYSRRRMWGVS